MAFADLANEIQNYLGKRDQEIRERLPQFCQGSERGWQVHFFRR